LSQIIETMMSILLATNIFITAILIGLSSRVVDNRLISSILGFMVTIILESIVFFWCRVIGIPFEFIIISWSVLNILLIYQKRSKITFTKPTISSKEIIASLIILGAAYLFQRYHHAFGSWDATAIWNLHASFLSHPESWRQYFTNELSWSHPDYPLGISAFIASFWNNGSISPLIPTFYHFSILLMLAIAIWNIINKKHSTTALIVLGILCLDRHFIARTTSEYADTTISLFYLMSTYLFYVTKDIKSNEIYAFLGFIAASTLWIKNEGILFFIIVSSIWIIWQWKNKKALIYFVSAAFPLVITRIYFSFYIAPNNVILQQRTSSIQELIFDISRYKIIVTGILESLVYFYPALIILGILVGFLKLKYKIHVFKKGLLILALVFGGYCFVYLITPYDLEWHVQHSIVRLIHQLYPALLLIFAYTISIFLNKKEAFIF